MLAQELLAILACPECKGDLEYKQNPEQLICNACKLRFSVKDDIPVMLTEEAEHF